MDGKQWLIDPGTRAEPWQACPRCGGDCVSSSVRVGDDESLIGAYWRWFDDDGWKLGQAGPLI
jgi:hypothetical protein